MSALSHKHRITVNAALATIHASGGDASFVTRTARTHMASGHDPRKAYELALNAFAASSPALSGTLERVTRLVQASDSATLAKYDTALNHYNATGDESGLNALTPMIEADMDALDVREDAKADAVANPADSPAAAPVAEQPRSFTNPAQSGGAGYRPSKSGEALARQTGVPLSYTGPAIDMPPSS